MIITEKLVLFHNEEEIAQQAMKLVKLSISERHVSLKEHIAIYGILDVEAIVHKHSPHFDKVNRVVVLKGKTEEEVKLKINESYKLESRYACSCNLAYMVAEYIICDRESRFSFWHETREKLYHFFAKQDKAGFKK